MCFCVLTASEMGIYLSINRYIFISVYMQPEADVRKLVLWYFLSRRNDLMNGICYEWVLRKSLPFRRASYILKTTQ